jgi:hypothetical protein
MNWIIKTEHRREGGGTVALELETVNRMFDVNVRWDGCMEIHVYATTEENRELEDIVRTCDIRAFIATLQSLDEACGQYFGAGSYWERNAGQDSVSYRDEIRKY